MSDLELERLRQAIRLTLMRRTTGLREASDVAEAALVTWGELSAHLAQVLGTRGVEVLLERAVHLVSEEFTWLAQKEGPPIEPLQDLRARLSAQPASTAVAASVALLLTFTELLTTLVGKTLGLRLLAPIWAPPRPSPEEQKT